MHRGFIKLHRKMLQWEWKDRPLTLALFIHLLMSANFKDTTWQGISISAGQVVVGRKKLSIETGLSEQQVRTALERLKTTNEITIKTTNKYSIISITNWNLYQDSNQQIPNKQPTNNQQITTSKECKERKECKEKNIGLRPLYISENLWNDFLAVRKAKKAPMTETALNGIQREADKAGISLENALQECCSRGWQGFKAEWYLNENRKGNHNGKQSNANAELEAFLAKLGD